MDRKKFTQHMAGKLVAIRYPQKDCAFLPDDLPPTQGFDVRLWPLLAEARECLGTLNGIGQTLPDSALLVRPLQNREAVTSSRIEGTFVTPEQLLLFELDPREPGATETEAQDWLDVFNYSQALSQGGTLLRKLPICNRVIREMHQVLMRGVRGSSKSPGEFRSVQVQIGSSGRFIPPEPQHVPGLMDRLEAYINAEDETFDPLVRCFLVHYQFEAIHPFADGNGRVGRALLALMIQSCHQHSLPWLYLSEFFDQYKDEYIEKLFQVSARGAWSEWIEFCLRGTISQANAAIRRCHELNALRAKFLKRLKDHTPRTHRIIEGLFRSPVLAVSTVEKEFKISYKTAKADIERLVAAKILSQRPGGRKTVYLADEILKIAYQV